MRVDVYQSLINAEKNTDMSTLTPEQKRLVTKMIAEGKRAGLALPDDKREQLKKVCVHLSPPYQNSPGLSSKKNSQKAARTFRFVCPMSP